MLKQVLVTHLVSNTFGWGFTRKTYAVATFPETADDAAIKQAVSALPLKDAQYEALTLINFVPTTRTVLVPDSK